MEFRLIFLLNEYHLAELHDEYFETIFASTDELILLNKEIIKLDKQQILKLVMKWMESASIDELERYWWDVRVRTKMECSNVECDGSCLECNKINYSIDIKDNTIFIEGII